MCILFSLYVHQVIAWRTISMLIMWLFSLIINTISVFIMCFYYLTLIINAISVFSMCLSSDFDHKRNLCIYYLTLWSETQSLFLSSNSSIITQYLCLETAGTSITACRIVNLPRFYIRNMWFSYANCPSILGQPDMPQMMSQSLFDHFLNPSN